MAESPNPEAQRLKQYWVHGQGALKIKWGTPGDYDRCIVELGRYIHSDRQLHGFCANAHHDALGIWPATHAAQERDHK